jgi:hypothetical protein
MEAAATDLVLLVGVPIGLTVWTARPAAFERD